MFLLILIPRMLRPLLRRMQHTQDGYGLCIFGIYHDKIRMDDHFPRTGDAAWFIHLWKPD